MDNENRNTGTNFIAEFKNAMGGMGVSAASASQALSNSITRMSNSTAGFPSPDEALDHAMMMDKAMTWLREGEGPPDAIRVLAEERAKELDVRVDFARALDHLGDVVWQVEVTTKRGSLRAHPYLTEKERVELALDLLPVAAWKNAMREVGLL